MSESASNKNNVIIGIVILIFLSIGLGLYIFFYYKNKNEDLSNPLKNDDGSLLDRYNDLEIDDGSLLYRYNDLENDYNELLGRYNDLEKESSELCIGVNIKSDKRLQKYIDKLNDVKSIIYRDIILQYLLKGLNYLNNGGYINNFFKYIYSIVALEHYFIIRQDLNMCSNILKYFTDSKDFIQQLELNSTSMNNLTNLTNLKNLENLENL